jgi:hypothetical protein
MPTRLLFAVSKENAHRFASLREELLLDGRDLDIEISRLDQLPDRTFDTIQSAVAGADAVIADFTPPGGAAVDGRSLRTAFAPDADVVTAAALARYGREGRPIALLMPPGARRPFDWGSVKPIPVGIPGTAEQFAAGAARILAGARAATPFATEWFVQPQPRYDEEAATPPEIFLAMPFQGYIGDKPPAPGFDFSHIHSAVETAAAAASKRLGTDVTVTIVGRKQHGARTIWHSIQQLIARATLVVADLSPDLASGTTANPNVVTEAALARDVYGHADTLTLLRQETAPGRPDDPVDVGLWDHLPQIRYAAAEGPPAEVIKRLTDAFVALLRPRLPRPACAPSPAPVPVAGGSRVGERFDPNQQVGAPPIPAGAVPTSRDRPDNGLSDDQVKLMLSLYIKEHRLFIHENAYEYRCVRTGGFLKKYWGYEYTPYCVDITRNESLPKSNPPDARFNRLRWLGAFEGLLANGQLVEERENVYRLSITGRALAHSVMLWAKQHEPEILPKVDMFD